MDTLVMIGQFALSLSILIILHECGHFFPARWFKTRVEKFYLFFDPWFSLFKKKIGETEYGIGWLPLGGYVKISGMIDESFDKDQLVGPPQPWEFRSKPAWQRLIIMLGGVTVNFILGILIFGFVLFCWGNEYLPNEEVTYGIAVDSLGYELGLRDGDHIKRVGDKDFDRFNPAVLITEIVINNAKEVEVVREGETVIIPVDEKFIGILTDQKNQKMTLFGVRLPFEVREVVESSPADQAGIQADDRIIAVNDIPTPFYHEFQKEVQKHAGEEVSLELIRGEADTLAKSLRLTEDAKIGVFAQPVEYYYNIQTEKYSLASAIPAGFDKGYTFLVSQLKAFGQIFRGKIKAKDSLGSFISIGRMYDTTWNWQRFWNMTAMLSILLGFINLLPIPALDGGHVMFLLFEVVTGVKPSDKFIEYATMAGFVLLVALMIYAIGLDISRLF